MVVDPVRTAVSNEVVPGPWEMPHGHVQGPRTAGVTGGGGQDVPRAPGLPPEALFLLMTQSGFLSQLDEEPAGRAGGGPGEGRNPQSTPGALHLDKILSVVGPVRGTCRKTAPLEIRGCFLPGEFSSGSSHTKFRGGFGGNLEAQGRGAAWWQVRWFRGALTWLAGVKGPDRRRGSGRSGRRAAVMSRGRSDRLRMKPRSGQKARVGE